MADEMDIGIPMNELSAPTSRRKVIAERNTTELNKITSLSNDRRRNERDLEARNGFVSVALDLSGRERGLKVFCYALCPLFGELV
jgi:hypothetical protein